MMTEECLYLEYEKNCRSAAEIAAKYHVSVGQVNYWLTRYRIRKRSISDAAYAKWNPSGNPFVFVPPKTLRDAYLFGLGIGLYWGEGTKRSRASVRLGNSDPHLISAFVTFLSCCYGIDKRKLRFGLQVFGDMDAERTRRFWVRFLGVPVSAFYKTVVTPHRGVGTYKRKTAHGVMTVYFNNTRLRDILVGTIAQLSDGKADVAQLVEHVLGGSQSSAHPRRRRQDESRITVNISRTRQDRGTRFEGPND